MKKKQRYKTALTIAGSDSGGGAGIQADLKTFSALGTYGLSVLTALTAQNTRGVRAVSRVPADFVKDQIDAVFEDIAIDSVKIGMLHRTEIIAVVSNRLRRHRAKNIVLDPVMIAKDNSTLLRESAIAILKEKLIPLATILTPNLPEASALVGRPVKTVDDMRYAGETLLRLGPKSVLIKGGHLKGNRCDDLLMLKDCAAAPLWLTSPRINTANIHGTGCTLSAAIAANLAKGLDLRTAVLAAKAYLSDAIRRGTRFKLGNGHGPVCHFKSSASQRYEE